MAYNEEKPETDLILTERPKVARERLERVLAIPELLNLVVDHVANGGSLLTLCRMWDVQYCKVLAWVYDQPGGKERYETSLERRVEWADEMVLTDLHTYAQADVRDLVDDEGRPRALEDLPDALAVSIQSIEVVEHVDIDTGQREITHKIKLVDKLKARDMLCRTRGKYIDKVEHSGSVSLEQMLTNSWKKPDES